MRASSLTALISADERAMSESLARTEMEYIKQQSYSDLSLPWFYELPGTLPSWDGSHSLPAGYDDYVVNVAGTAIPGKTDIQKITIIVTHPGTAVGMSGNVTLEDYKVNR